MRIAPVYRPVFEDRHRIIALWGGRNAGRSHTVARKWAIDATTSKKRLACIRQTRESTNSSQKVEIRGAISELGWESAWTMPDSGNFRCRASDSEIMFLGLHGQEGLKSLADIDGVWVEEAQLAEDPSWSQFLDTVLRKAGVKVILTGNPRYASDPAYRWSIEQREEDYFLMLHTTHRDNPWFSEEARAQMELVKRTDRALYDWEWEGVPLGSSAESTVLSVDWIEASMRLWEVHHRDLAQFSVHRDFGLDPSDGGGDESVFSVCSGPFAEHCEIVTEQKGKVGKALERIDALAKDYRASRLYYDSGAVVGSQVASWYHGRVGVPYIVRGVAFNDAPMAASRLYEPGTDNQTKFRYRHGQMAWGLRHALNAAWLKEQGENVPLEQCLVIDPSCANGRNGAPTRTRFIEQMTQAEWEPKEGGRVQIIKAPRGLPSPDVFDSFRLSNHRRIEGGLTLRS